MRAYLKYFFIVVGIWTCSSSQAITCFKNLEEFAAVESQLPVYFRGAFPMEFHGETFSTKVTGTIVYNPQLKMFGFNCQGTLMKVPFSDEGHLVQACFETDEETKKQRISLTRDSGSVINAEFTKTGILIKGMDLKRVHRAATESAASAPKAAE